MLAKLHFVRAVPRARVRIGEGCKCVRGRSLVLMAGKGTLLLRNVHWVSTLCALAPLCDERHMHQPGRNFTSLKVICKHKTYSIMATHQQRQMQMSACLAPRVAALQAAICSALS